MKKIFLYACTLYYMQLTPMQKQDFDARYNALMNLCIEYNKRIELIMESTVSEEHKTNNLIELEVLVNYLQQSIEKLAIDNCLVLNKSTLKKAKKFMFLENPQAS